MLNTTAEGQQILRSYSLRNILKPNEKQILTNLLINKILAEKCSFGVAERIKLAQLICARFPGEEQSIYYTQAFNKKRASGLIHNRYYNKRKYQERKEDFFETVVLPETKTLSPEFDESLLNSVKAELKNINLPIEILQEKWRTTFPLRRKQAMEGDKSLLLHWPLLKNATHAIKLVSRNND